LKLPYTVHDEREAQAYLETLYILDGEQQIEARWKRTGENEFMSRAFFGTLREVQDTALDLRHVHDVYVGVAPRRDRIGTKEGVTHLRAIWADLDAKDGHTRESRWEQLMDLPYHPSMMVWTGAGWHVYWLLREPAEGQEELDRAEALMGRLAEGLDGDHVGDRARILRPPGTFNHKYDEPRRVTLEYCDQDKRFALGQL
jgi:hypothetical protein